MGRTAVVKEIKAMVYVFVALSTLTQMWLPIQVSFIPVDSCQCFAQ